MNGDGVSRAGGGLLTAVALWGSAGAAWGAGQAAAPGRQGELLQRQQEEQLRRDQDKNRRLNGPQTSIEAPAPAPLRARPGGPCRQVDRIVVTGASLASPRRQVLWTAPYAGRCLDVAAVEHLLSDITRDYLGRGYITARVYVLPQTLSTGVLALRVVEGRVQAIRPGAQADGSVNLATALPIPKGALLNLRDFEQGLDQLNQLASNHATMEIRPGDLPGESVVVINNTPTKRWHVFASVDDTGQTSTGRTQASATVSYDNLLGLNDFVSYTRRQSVPFPKADRSSEANSATFGIPYGRFNALLGYSDSAYESKLTDGLGNTFHLSGTTQTEFAEVQGLVTRDQVSRLNLAVGFSNKRNSNYIDGSRLSVSSRTLDALDLRADYSRLLPKRGGVLKATLTFSRGLRVLGALKDPSGLSDGAPRAQFSRLSLSGVYAQPLPIAGQVLSLTTEFNGQVSDHGLYSSEQLLLGSPYTVRGFYNQSLTADRGLYIRNTISYSKRLSLPQGVSGGARAYAGIDAGYGESVEKTAPRGVVAGAIAGVAVDAGPVVLDVSTARSIARAGLKDEHFTTFVRLSAGF